MSQIFLFSAIAVEEIDLPRPHYRVEVRAVLTAASGLQDPTLGLLPEDVVMTVRLPTDVGSDLVVIRRAACQRALILLENLTQNSRDMFDRSTPAKARSAIADA